MSIDLQTKLADAMSGSRFDVLSPHDPEYGYDPDEWTDSQEKAWEYWWEQTAKHHNHVEEHGYQDAPDGSPLPPVRVAMIGGKGSGKTYAGAMFAAEMAQRYPGSLGMFASGTFPQVNKNISPHFREVMNRLGVKYSYHSQRTIQGRVYDKVFVVHLSRNVKSFVCLTSFENMDTIEGSEWDWQVYTEIQAADREDFEVAIARNRGKKANRGVFVDGLPANADHWQYQVLERDLNFRFFEPSLRENIHNVGQDYLDMLMRLYDKQKAQAYIEGKRISLNSNAVFYAFDYERHVQGKMSRVLTDYEPDRELIISFDFNLRPMSVSVWQPKVWVPEEGTESRTVYAQIDEFEVWEGGTPATVEKIIARYGNHTSGGIVIGDAAGRARNTVDPGKTDWSVIKEAFLPIRKMKVKPGLIKRGTDGQGRVTYSNPPVRDTLNRANALLMNANDEIGVVFLPESEFESGGVWRSVSRLKRTADGKIDKSIDKKEGRDVPRTHFSDTFRYFAYHITGGEARFDRDKVKKIMNSNKNIVTSNNSDYGGSGKQFNRSGGSSGRSFSGGLRSERKSYIL